MNVLLPIPTSGNPTAPFIRASVVVDPGPSYRMVPYDTTQPTKRERHEAASIDYIIVD
jgi:hypothetical protein